MTYITPIESSRRALAFGSVKTRFKAFWSMLFLNICMRPWIRSLRFYWTFAPGGRLNYEVHNVDTKPYINISIKMFKLIIKIAILANI